MNRSCLVLLAIVLATMGRPVFAKEACMPLGAPEIANCKKIDVPAVAKSYLDLYRMQDGKAVLDRSLARDKICVPFQATDCNVREFLAVETETHERLLFHRADLAAEASPGSCVCAAAYTQGVGQQNVIGAPGAGRLPECPKEQCPQ